MFYSEIIENKINLVLSNAPEFLETQLTGVDLEPVGKDYRLQPCPYCGHNDCATMTPGYPVINCFSGGCSEQHYGIIDAIAKNTGKAKPAIMDELAKKLNIEQRQEDIARQRSQQLKQIAVDFYHKRLLEDEAAMRYLTETRQRREETVRTYKIGLGGNIQELKDQLAKAGYTGEEIDANKEILVNMQVLVYPYIDFQTGYITRINTKTLPGVEFRGYSAGKRTLYRSQGYDHNTAIVVEGENDLHALTEQGAASVVALGGTPSADIIKELCEFKKLYLMLDNDDPGQRMAERLNDDLPHVDIYEISYDDAKDPDEYFKNITEVPEIRDLVNHAVPLQNEGFIVMNEGGSWILAARGLKIIVNNLSRDKNGEFSGNIGICENGQAEDVFYGQKLTKLKRKDYAIKFQRELENIFDKPLARSSRTIDELVDLYPLSHSKSELKTIMAKILQKEEDHGNKISSHIRRKLGSDVLTEILQEVNDLANQDLEEIRDIPRMKVSQFYNIKNNDAFLYYTRITRDEEGFKKLPHVLSNTGEDIPLYLLRKKDQNSLLLLKQRYELPEEVIYPLGELDDISLSQHWVDGFITGKVPDEDLDISRLVRMLEANIKKFYYHADKDVFKVLALWIYGTYYYELFKCYPYLYLNGNKGSGKSRLDQVLKLFAFNPKYGVNITGPALFRTIHGVGGTLILDEIENLTDKRMVQDSDLATILKAGYEDGARSFRCEGDTSSGINVKSFNVYGPKVISNIYGLDSVIGDRCIKIMSYAAPIDLDFEDPKFYREEHGEAVSELTSKCCLSALKHFQEVYDRYKSGTFKGLTARLSQIMKPLVTLSEIVGEDYKEALIRYYSTHSVDLKVDDEENTPEGLLPEILSTVAQELIGRAEPNITRNGGKLPTSRYDNSDGNAGQNEAIHIIPGEGCFEISDLMLKVLIEESIPGTTINLEYLRPLIRRVVGNLIKSGRRTRVEINPEDFKEFHGSSRANIYYYKFEYQGFVDDYEPGEEAKKIYVPDFDDM